MIRSINDYKAWWQALATAKGLDFVYGGSDRILNRQNMNLTYPVLWVGVPEIRRQRNGMLKKVFDGWFIVLQDAAIDDEAAQDTALNEMEQLTEAILAAMMAAKFALAFEFDAEDTVSYYKPKQTNDDAWGWFTEFKLIGSTVEDPDCL